ncbi:ImmA/IrrE family metallo-endopeptidase [Maribacter chungangensis]|uniref:ImmA/IrrE family metallo-endopeptidase n=1 Tax=Maribacter chungangensis TaxID=1069117 RepID=A0ABW3B541_9FLAO
MSQQKKKPKFKRGFKKWSDDKCLELRKKLGLKNISPLCGFDLCKFFKIPILTPGEIKGQDPKMLKHLLSNGSNDWSAATVPLGNDKYLVIHNNTHSLPRQQSNVMHELAHIICGHKVDQDKLSLGLSGFLRDYNEEQENEAEWLGACLQLPRPALIWALKKGMSERDIADYFNASIEMTRYRINITGVKAQLHYSKLNRYNYP